MGSCLSKDSGKTYIKLPMFLIKNILTYIPDDSLIKNCLTLNKYIHNAFKINKIEFKKNFDINDTFKEKRSYDYFDCIKLLGEDDYINIDLKDVIPRNGSLREFSFNIQVSSVGVWGIFNNNLNEDMEFIISDSETKLELYKEIIIKKRTEENKFTLNIKKSDLNKFLCKEKIKILWNLLSNSKNTISIKCKSKMCIRSYGYVFKNFYINRDIQ